MNATLQFASGFQETLCDVQGLPDLIVLDRRHYFALNSARAEGANYREVKALLVASGPPVGTLAMAAGKESDGHIISD